MSSGIRCGSPAERGQSRCFYHHSVRMLLPKRFVARESFRNEWEHGVRMFPMPLLEDATSIQTALMQVIHAMLEGALPVPTARIVLSALRLSQRNLPALKLEMAAVTEAPREIPSDASETRGMTWPNRSDDKWPNEHWPRTESPSHLNGDLGHATPKIPPDSEPNEPASDAASAETTVACAARATTSALPQKEAAAGEGARQSADGTAVATGVPLSSPGGGETVGHDSSSPQPPRKEPEPASDDKPNVKAVAGG